MEKPALGQINIQASPDGKNALVSVNILGASINTIVVPGPLVDNFVKEWLMMKQAQAKLFRSIKESKV